MKIKSPRHVLQYYHNTDGKWVNSAIRSVRDVADGFDTARRLNQNGFKYRLYDTVTKSEVTSVTKPKVKAKSSTRKRYWITYRFTDRTRHQDPWSETTYVTEKASRLGMTREKAKAAITAIRERRRNSDLFTYRLQTTKPKF